MKDIYWSFNELIKTEKEWIDFTIDYKTNNPDIVIFTPHGWWIEPGTTEIVKGIAKDNFSYYTFNWIKKENNRILHITSEKFDEPKAKEIISKSKITISIHGCNWNEDMIYIWWMDDRLKKEIAEALNKHNLNTEIIYRWNFSWKGKNNICNTNYYNKWVQIELTRSIRKKMFDNLTYKWRTKTNKLLEIVSEIIQNAVSKFIVKK
jgi:phage replication-related protein YjqB (UPF0714/DUF867 family)